ncbi:MAG: hypothetical protein ABI210_03755, partial [Abditibacteriaceae bacterium]
MQHEKEPSPLLNIVCILLPFPVTLLLPLPLSFLVSIALGSLIDGSVRHKIAIAIPITYFIFVALEFALAIFFAKTASSPRSKTAAR